MIALADERADGREPVAHVDQVGERSHLPGQVVQAGRGPGLRRARAGAGLDVADLEQAQVVVVDGIGRAQEGGPAGNLGADLKAERLAVEADRAGQVADVEDGVVQAADRHSGLPPAGPGPGRPRLGAASLGHGYLAWENSPERGAGQLPSCRRGCPRAGGAAGTVQHQVRRGRDRDRRGDNSTGSHHGMNPSRIRPTMTPPIAHFMWGVMVDSIHPGWDAAPRLLAGKPADARAARH